MEGYGITTVSNTFQNLKMEEEQKKQTNDEITKAFNKFIKEYRLGDIYKYRDQLNENMQKEIYKMEFDFEDIDSENRNLADLLINQPSIVVPLFENAIKEVCYEFTSTKKEVSIEQIPNFQLILNNFSSPKNIRDLNSSTINQLVVTTGIIVSSSKAMIKTYKCALQCRNCGNMKYIEVLSGFSSIQIPRRCDSTRMPTERKEQCPLDSYTIVPEQSKYIDMQTLKIQEAPEMIPVGEIPRAYMVYCERYLVNKVSPGTRLTVIGIQCVDERTREKGESGSYIKALQFLTENKKTGRQTFTFTHDDEMKFNTYAKDEKIYDKISRSIAPGIFGSEDIKRAIACFLFGGCRKKMNEGVNLRGDINILLLGDPSTAKSQFLKFAERVAPIAVYTSGKGSSAAGLTASIIKDPSSGEFQLEGGAMVLADGGIVCIDEFDKMRAQDRVAIHEAMEQQTISVAKAGITTTLNSRTSVLAAANPIYGRIDDLKSTQDQIDFQTTILSRFDCIFLIKDVHDTKRDEMMANHIVDINALGKINEKREEGEIPLNDLKKFISFARMKCTPKLTNEAGETLKNYYVADRKKSMEYKSKKGNDIPITVRQLEAIIRLSEAIAKMNLSSIVTQSHVMEAHRLFEISTISAASFEGAQGPMLGPEHQREVIRIEEAIKRRISQGQRMQTSKILEELSTKYTNTRFITAALMNLVKTDVLKFSENKKIITRRK